MNLRLKLTLAAATLLAAASLDARAQPWETYPQVGFSPWDIAAHPDGSVAYAVNDVLIRRGDAGGTLWSDGNLPLAPSGYELLSGNPKLSVGPSGSVYLSGGLRKLSDGSRAFHLWESSDSATTWQTVLSLPLTSTRPSDAGIGSVATDAAGNIYVANMYLPGNPGSWAGTLNYYRIRQGVTDPQTGDVTWTIINQYPASGQLSHRAGSVTIRPRTKPALPAEIWVAGSGIDAKTYKNSFPFARRSLDGGATWATVNPWPVPSGYSFSSGGVVAGADVNGVSYVSVSYQKKVGRTLQNYWLTYSSLNQGETWTLEDTLSVGTAFGPSQFAADTLGRVFIAGGGFVRVIEDGGATRYNADVAGGQCVAADLAGSVFVGGYTTEGVIYKLPAP